MKKDFTIYYVSSTHWDREWYLPFQGFRYRLVKVIDDMVEKLETDDGLSFMLDGQTVVLEDYSEVSGERSARLKKLINEGRVSVGPWYVMPDEFLVSGESLIRNLALGARLAENWGAQVLKYGYINDIFGHIAQLPQILAGFGIEGAYLGRGVSNDRNISHFVWKSPDGTECIASLGQYCALDNYCIITNYDKNDFECVLKKYIDGEIAKSSAPIVLIMHSGDHIYLNKNVSEIKKKIKKLYPCADLKQVPVSEMIPHLRKYSDSLPVIEGELNEPCKKPLEYNNYNGLPLIGNSLSSYYTLKYKNDRCQNILEKTLEPMILMSDLLGRHIDHKYIDIAYKYLLKNQPHDSICGCSVDATHSDMLYRYAQVENISDALKYDFLKNENDFEETENYTLSVYHFEPYRERRAVIAEIEFSGNFPKDIDLYRSNEKIDAFEIYDIRGAKVPYQILNTEFDCTKRVCDQKIQKTRKYKILFIGELPAMGIAQYKITPVYPRAASAKGCVSGYDYAENEFVKVSITPYGELELFDKKTNNEYRGLNRFIDDGEYGDGWRHMPPRNDIAVNSLGSPCTIEKISNGEISVSFKITKQLSVPESFDEFNHIRSKTRVALNIESVVTLYVDSPVIEIKTSVNNSVKDHRLRVIFPTNLKSKEYFAGQAFYKLKRSTSIATDNDGYYEKEMREKNMNGIIGVTNDCGNGLAFVSPYGLHEGAVNEAGDISVTLLRSFHKVFMQPHAEKSQLQQTLEYKYAIVPLCNGVEYCDLLKIQNTLADTGIIGFQKNPNGMALCEKSYLEIDNKRVAASVIKNSDDGCGKILRVFSTSEKTEKCNILLGFAAHSAYLTNLDETIIKELNIVNNSIQIEVPKWKIITVKLI